MSNISHTPKPNILQYLFQLLWFLKYHTNTRFQVLIDICGVDHPSRKRRFEVVYNLLRATAKEANVS